MFSSGSPLQMLFCGKSFTLAGTETNTLFFWGSKSKKKTDNGSEKNDTECEKKEKKGHKRQPSESLSVESSDSTLAG